jgi:hypothetical protein
MYTIVRKEEFRHNEKLKSIIGYVADELLRIGRGGKTM